MKEDFNITEEELALLEAEEIKSSKSYTMELLIVGMVAVMALLYFAHNFYVIIPAGNKGVMFFPLQGGTRVEGAYYDEGFHLKLPWNEVILYDTRIREQQDTVTALTEDGLEVTIEISYRYFPDYTRIGRLHRELGPEYLQTILIPQVTAITRDVISRYRVDKLYSTGRDSIQMYMTQKSQHQVTDNYPISIVDIVIRNINLPTQVADAIAKKLVQEQRLETAKKEALRKEIEAKGIRAFTSISKIDLLKWEGINATKELATSPNAKVIVIGTSSRDLPVILGGNN